MAELAGNALQYMSIQHGYDTVIVLQRRVALKYACFRVISDTNSYSILCIFIVYTSISSVILESVPKYEMHAIILATSNASALKEVTRTPGFVAHQHCLPDRRNSTLTELVSTAPAHLAQPSDLRTLVVSANYLRCLGTHRVRKNDGILVATTLPSNCKQVNSSLPSLGSICLNPS